MREAKDRVMRLFCMKTDREIENLDTKTTISKNLCGRSVRPLQSLPKGSSPRVFTRKWFDKHQLVAINWSISCLVI